MSNIRHPNIILFLGASMYVDEPFLLTDFAERGNLNQVITDQNPGWRQRLNFAHDIALGMCYLHQRTPYILHRDLKSSNILVDKDYRAKLCDFGISKTVSEEADINTTTTCGTICYVAPEVLIEYRFGTASDVYSFGMVLWEILTGKFPWYGVKLFHIFEQVRGGKRPQIPEATDPTYSKLIMVRLVFFLC